MATPATPLLADFDFNLITRTQTLPRFPHQPQRPSTPDPRRTPTPHPPRPLHHSFSSLSTGKDRRRLRKKPTAIFVGGEASASTPAHWPCTGEVEPRTDLHPSSQPTLPPVPPPVPTTPSPRFATSPSLSSSGTTVQSSPTVTPTDAYFGSSYSEPRPTAKSLETFDSLDKTHGRFHLKRAKRLPHRDQGLWEVHAVVHISEGDQGGGGSGGSGGRTGQEQHSHYDWCIQQQQQSGFLDLEHCRQPTVTTSTQRVENAAGSPIGQKKAAAGDYRPKGIHGILSESDRREGRLRKPRPVDSSSYSISKYHFPAPPGDYRIGLSGDLQHPAKVHYRGASFDLVNPHASLLLSSSQFETPAEIDVLLDDYFENSDAMPRALYTDPETARRNIMGLDGTGEAAGTTTSSQESSAASLVPSKAPSDPFDLRMSDVPSQAAQTVHESAAEGSTIAGIFDDYDYTRETPREHEETLRILESRSPALHSDEVFAQLSPEIQQHMSAEFSELSHQASSELPTSQRTYGDTRQLLALTPRHPDPEVLPATTYEGPEPRMRPAPGRSTTETTMTESGLRSATASLHEGDSPQESLASQSTERARGVALGQFDFREISSNTMRSNEEGDWETTKSESNIALLPGRDRDSYANTSTYSEGNRLSAMSEVAVPHQQPPGPRAAPRTGTATRSGNANALDVERAKRALEKIYRDKVLEQGTFANPSRDRPGPLEMQPRGRGLFQGMLDRRQSAIMQSRNNDIELEEIRRKNPEAVRLAAEQVYAENVAEQITPPRPIMPMDRLRGVFGRCPSAMAQRANRNLMDEALADDSRNLLARTPTAEDRSSRLEFSESANTFRTFRATPVSSQASSRTGLDLGERSSGLSLPVPAATYNSAERSRRNAPPTPLDSRGLGLRQARKPARRAAMSSQTSLRAFITSGSPTSNIQGAFTDREMAEASRRWDTLPRHNTYNQRFHRRNASSPFPRFDNSPIPYPISEGRMLVHPSEIIDPRLQLLQERLSKRYLMRMLACPPMCVLYRIGYYDYLIAKQTDGSIKTMSPEKKDDALAWAILVSIVYSLIIVGIVVAAAISRQK